MARFASETTVPVEKSRAEIESLVTKYGASEFQSGWKAGEARIGFRIRNIDVRFILPIPDKTEKRFTHKKDRYGFEKPMPEAQRQKAWEQECRQRWRALALVVKAKLEAVECGISTIEQEFLAFIVLPNDMSMMDWLKEEALPMIVSGEQPRLALPEHRGPRIVQTDAS